MAHIVIPDASTGAINQFGNMPLADISLASGSDRQNLV